MPAAPRQDFNPLVAKFVHVPPKADPTSACNSADQQGAAAAATAAGTEAEPEGTWVTLPLPEGALLEPKLVVLAWGEAMGDER